MPDKIAHDAGWDEWFEYNCRRKIREEELTAAQWNTLYHTLVAQIAAIEAEDAKNSKLNKGKKLKGAPMISSKNLDNTR